MRVSKLVGIVIRSDLVRTLAQKLSEKEPSPPRPLSVDEALRRAQEKAVADVRGPPPALTLAEPQGLPCEPSWSYHPTWIKRRFPSEKRYRVLECVRRVDQPLRFLRQHFPGINEAPGFPVEFSLRSRDRHRPVLLCRESSKDHAVSRRAWSYRWRRDHTRS